MDNPIVILDKESIKNLIYEIRGQKVMLDFDLAHIYDYATRDFNNQVKRNRDRFDDDFAFQLTKEEWKEILMLQKSTSSWGGRRKPPFAFTEQGIYMLMTVLRGEKAIQQSKTLIRLFKSMTDYLVESEHLVETNEVLHLVRQVNQKRRKTL